MRQARGRLSISVCIALCMIVSFAATSMVVAQTEEERIDAELPERVQIPVLDVTYIQLVPRKRFEGSGKPHIGTHYGIYAKERAWTMSPAVTLPRFYPLARKPIPELQVVLNAAPRVPGSFVYDALLLRSLDQGYGLVRLGQNFLSGSQTIDTRHYRTSDARASLGYWDREGAYLDADFRYLTKDNEWLPKSDDNDPQGLTPGGGLEFQRRDTSLLEGWLHWNEPVGKDSQFELTLDASTYQLQAEQQADERATDARLNAQMTTLWPSLYPFRFGAVMEFYSAEGTWPTEDVWDATALRMYVRDSLIHLGPFVADGRLELATLWEINENQRGERLYYPNPEITLTTQMSRNLAWMIVGGRTVERVRPRTLYVDRDYAVMHPSLKAEKSWYGETSLLLNPSRIVGLLKIGVQRTDDLTVWRLVESQDLIAWQPAEMDARLFYASMSTTWEPTDRMRLTMSFRHEVHKPLRFGEEKPLHIPFRPKDTAEVMVSYTTLTGWALELMGRYTGERYVDMQEDERLEGYLLVQPKIRYAMSEYTEVYVKARLSLGEYRHHPSYDLPQHIADFGVTLRF